MKTLTLAGFLIVVLAASLAPSAPAIGAEPFHVQVCELLPKPFLGFATYDSGEGCTWGIRAPDETTIANEDGRGTATRYQSPELMRSIADGLLVSYQEAAASGGTLEELHVCDGGWQVYGSLPRHPPSHVGYYTCGNVLVMVSMQGADSVRQFMHVAAGIKPLLSLLP
jgi:hypothetical protein